MPPYLTWLLIGWGVLTGILIILLIYRGTLTMQEDDQLFLDESASQMAAEQRELMAKVNKINPLVKVLGATSGLVFLVIAGLFIYSALNPAAHPVPIDDLYYTRNVAGGAWSPDGKQVVFTTDMSGRLNLWKVNAPGSWPIQLTQSDDRQFNPAWSPDGKWIVYQQDKGGNELWDLYAVPAEGGEIVNLTNTPEIREESPLWSPNGTALAVNYKPKESTVYDIALLD